MRQLSQLVAVSRERDFRSTMWALLYRAVSRAKRLQDPYFVRRAQLGAQVHHQLGGTIASGPFQGVRLALPSWWSQSDIGGMLLGLYEAELSGLISGLPASHQTLINIGAGDGYYPVGFARLFPESRVYCFEISAAGRKGIGYNAALNNAASRIEILEEATPNSVLGLSSDYGVDLSKCLVLVDIEGGEYDLLTDEILLALRGSYLLVEIHRTAANNDSAFEGLVQRCAYWNCREVRKGSRDPGNLEATKGLSDDDLWALCSEGRAYQMTWLYCEPRE
jgi:hypothetical protein